MKQTQKQIDESKVLRPIMYGLVGETLNTFNILEDYIRTCIATLANLEDPFITEILFGKLNSRLLVDVFKSLAMYRTNNYQTLNTQRKKLVLELEDRIKERNMLVHAIWGIEFVNMESVGIYHTRYINATKESPISSFSKTYSEDEFKTLIDKATQTYVLLDGFMNEFRKRSKTNNVHANQQPKLTK